MRVVLIGAGISSSLISLLLRRQFGPQLKLVVYDKGRAIGGRMTTTFDNETNPHCSVDTGAQYLTMSKSNGVTKKFFQQLIDDQVIELLNKENTIGLRENAEKIDYTAPRGISSVVRYFFEQAAVEMNLSKHITEINLDLKTNKYQLTLKDNQKHEAEAVIVTIPVPQVLTQLKGSIGQIIENQNDVKEKLSQIKYSTRFAVGLFYPPSVTSLNVPWSICYVDKNQNDCLRFLAVDNAKRNKNEPPLSLVAHTTVEFGEKHVEDDKTIVGEQIRDKIFEFLPELPREFNSIKFHKWKYSQVVRSYPGHPGCVVLHDQPALILSGDGFAPEGNFEGCIQSAIDTVKQFCDLAK